ncbi:LANO_0H05534g1_1 [Lachancea nothofagi CBS 11611]|uniref:Small nuclear ribonucleoprotein Sm D3 n=1 Tax=Lachancea nothofagi CBS 11611 TaxID=1266666 RepID=A0A1G4KLJ5_9SACH|nr:LANO_0H05534g1_1 [Lachancea nothofagi CBS 11611]
MSANGIPIKLLTESQGHVVSVELTTGEVYRGKLVDSEENMNVQLRDVTATARDGSVTRMDHIFVRGSHIRFFVVPDILKNAPMFKQGPSSRPPPPIRGPKRK